MLKVLHVTGDSKFGGGSIVILRLAELAKQQGWQVDVLTTDLAFQKALSRSEIGVAPLDCIWRDISTLRDLQGLYRLSAFLRSAGYALVHTHTSKAGFVGRLAAKLAGVPVILHTAHGFAFHEGSSPLAVRAFAALERLAAYAADSVVTVSEFHRDWAERLGIGSPNKLVAIPNGIPPERVRPSLLRMQLRTDLGFDLDEYVVLSIGRLAPHKGLEYLIQAVPSLNSRLGRTLKVVLAGEGPARSAIETQVEALGIRSQVRFLGFRNDIGDLLEASDLVVLPSLREGLSIALLEAMAARKPIVTTSIGSNLEVTMQGLVALLVPPKNSTALTEAILRLAFNPREADRLAQAAYAHYLATYTEERMLAAYLERYRQLLRCKAILSDG
jgi:glycosyltransferase involved in cell wall biosynthesis